MLLTRMFSVVPIPAKGVIPIWIEKLAGRYPAWVVADACEALIETYQYPNPPSYADLKAKIDANKRYQRFATQRSNMMRAIKQLRRDEEGPRGEPIKGHCPRIQRIEPEPREPTKSEWLAMQRKIVAECEAAGLYDTAPQGAAE